MAIATLGGVAFALVVPPTDFVPLAWVGLAGLAYALDHRNPIPHPFPASEEGESLDSRDLTGLATGETRDSPALPAGRGTGGGVSASAPLVVQRAWFDGGARGLAFGFGVSVVALRFVPRVIARFTPLPLVAGLVALVLLALAQGLPWAAAGIARTALARARVPRPIAFAAGCTSRRSSPRSSPGPPPQR